MHLIYLVYKRFSDTFQATVLLLAPVGLMVGSDLLHLPWGINLLIGWAGIIVVLTNVFRRTSVPTQQKRLRRLSQGVFALQQFLIGFAALAVCLIVLISLRGIQSVILYSLYSAGVLFLLFWSGITLVYVSSVQLGIRYRVVGLLCGWIIGVNIVVLLKIIEICSKEIHDEFELEEYGNVAALTQDCATVYPILLVHGVFFRDMKYLNYWGRIPKFLKQAGARIEYGEQESAASIEVCGEQLAQRIKAITEKYQCEKVNIIAHSKGGLDSRYAISQCGAAPYVASLTTINTPHNGCIFANYLLKNAPKSWVKQLGRSYNRLFRKMGDQHPDFLGAVNALTDESCAALNPDMPDQSGVFYHSVMSYVNRASSGRFPLNVTYPLVKHFDGQTDGLVSVTSAQRWENYTVIKPPANRGISHADMIDLNRENIKGFDVRLFYKELVMHLKEIGF